MSSLQTGQLISLLVNNVLMVIIVAAVTLVAWLRWQWLRTECRRMRSGRQRCRWAYVSFVLTVVTWLGMLLSLGLLTLRTMLTINGLVVSAMAMFLISTSTLFIALGLWVWDMCWDLSMPRHSLLSVLTAGHRRRRGTRRTQRRQQQKAPQRLPAGLLRS